VSWRCDEMLTELNGEIVSRDMKRREDNHKIIGIDTYQRRKPNSLNLEWRETIGLVCQSRATMHWRCRSRKGRIPIV
jgi:hypothetical protein